MVYVVTNDADGTEREMRFKGRNAWALDELIEGRETGCTPITQPAPRWSGYVHNLRRAGISIETLHEPHGGKFRGHHARYILRSQVRRVTPFDEIVREAA